MDLKRVSPSEAQQLVDQQGYVLLDVRSVPEFEGARVPSAHNVPFLHKAPSGMVLNQGFGAAVKALIPDTAKGVVVHCGMGARSLRAAQELQGLGYTQVVDMRGGFEGEKDESGQLVNPGWQDMGLPVAHGPGSARGYVVPPEDVFRGETSPLIPPESTEVASAGSQGESVIAAPDGMNRFASDKRKVQCVRFKKELPGLKRRPYPGELGVRLFENISAAAWDEWVEHSKMIINEYRIVSTDPKAMEMLYEQCEQFFFGGGVVRPSEYVPPTE